MTVDIRSLNLFKYHSRVAHHSCKLVLFKSPNRGGRLRSYLTHTHTHTHIDCLACLIACHLSEARYIHSCTEPCCLDSHLSMKCRTFFLNSHLTQLFPSTFHSLKITRWTPASSVALLVYVLFDVALTLESQENAQTDHHICILIHRLHQSRVVFYYHSICLNDK